MLTFDLAHPRSRDARVTLRALSTKRLVISVLGGVVVLLAVKLTVLAAVLIAGIVLWDVVHVLEVKRDPFLWQPPNKRLEPTRREKIEMGHSSSAPRGPGASR